MADMITIEGSLTPSVELPRGQRRTVVRTERIERLIERGYIVEVKDDAPEPAAQVSEPATAESKPADLPEPEHAADPEPAAKPTRTSAAAKAADGK